MLSSRVGSTQELVGTRGTMQAPFDVSTLPPALRKSQIFPGRRKESLNNDATERSSDYDSRRPWNAGSIMCCCPKSCHCDGEPAKPKEPRKFRIDFTQTQRPPSDHVPIYHVSHADGPPSRSYDYPPPTHKEDVDKFIKWVGPGSKPKDDVDNFIDWVGPGPRPSPKPALITARNPHEPIPLRRRRKSRSRHVERCEPCCCQPCCQPQQSGSNQSREYEQWCEREYNRYLREYDEWVRRYF